MKKLSMILLVFGLTMGVHFSSTAAIVGPSGNNKIITQGGPGAKKEAIDSKTGSDYGVGLTKDPATRIYISKNKKVLVLYQNNKEVNRWDCEMGRNTLSGDKIARGDSITPTGTFYICTRNAQSSYYLSLGLSYPSIDDAKGGLERGVITQMEHDAIVDAIQQRICPPWDTALGGTIMIHGNYQKGIGTSGCVTVPNEVMDILWQYGQMGVRVDVGA